MIKALVIRRNQTYVTICKGCYKDIRIGEIYYKWKGYTYCRKCIPSIAPELVRKNPRRKRYAFVLVQ